MNHRRALCARCGSDSIRSAGNALQRLTAWLLRRTMVRCSRCGWKGHVVTRAHDTGSTGGGSRRRRRSGRLEASPLLPADREPNLVAVDREMGWPDDRGSGRRTNDRST